MKKPLRVLIFVRILCICIIIVLLYSLSYRKKDVCSMDIVEVEIAKNSEGNTEKEVNIDDWYNGLWIVNSIRNSHTWPDPAFNCSLPTNAGICISRQFLTTTNSDVRVKTASSVRTSAKVRDSSPTIAVLVLACNRTSTIRKCLDKLLIYRTSPDRFPIVVSLGCDHEATTSALSSYNSSITLIQLRNQSKLQLHFAERSHEKYFYIARHYRWALNQTFFKLHFESAIVLEDDLEVAADFFEFFSGTWPLLRADPSLWCVSAWNDNGKPSLVDPTRAEQLFRTDFFPGLAWMLTRATWVELEPKWPPAFWEDWMRAPEQRRERACVRPELPRARVAHERKDEHLRHIALSDRFVPFADKNLSYLLKDNYDVEFVRRAYDCPVLNYRKLVSGPGRHGRIRYNTRRDFGLIAKALGLARDFRSGVPRTAYRGIVTCVFKGHRVYLTPHNWKSYDLSWV